MKRIYVSALALFLPLSSLLFSACDPKGDIANEQPYTETEQKAKLEETAKELINEFQVSDFKDLAGFAQKAMETNPMALSTPIQKTLQKIFETASKPNQSTAEIIWKASQFNGHYKAVNGTWEKENGEFNDLQFTFDANGKKCFVNLGTEGKETIIHHKVFNGEGAENKVAIPEKAVLYIVEDGKTLARIEVKTDITNGDPLGSKTKLEVKTIADIGPFTFSINQLMVNASEKANYAIEVKKGKKILLSSQGDIFGAFSDVNQKFSISKVVATASALNKVRVGVIALDVPVLLMEGDNKDEDLKATKELAYLEKKAEEMNKSFTGQVYFDNHIKPDAVVKFMVEKDTYNGKVVDLGISPAIKFTDGSTYLFKQYFSENNFGDLITLIENKQVEFIQTFSKILQAFQKQNEVSED